MSQFDLNAFLAGTNTPTSPTPSALSGTSQQFDLNAFLGNTNTPEANAQPTVATVQPTQIEATKTEAVAGALPLSNLEQNTATQQAKAYADQFNQQIAQYKSNALAKYEANDNHSKLDKFFTRRDYDDLMALSEYKAFLKYQGELRQHLDNNPKYSEQQKAYLLEEFDKMANPYHRADTWTNAASDFLVSAVESFPRSGERLANNLGARSWAANWLRSGANKVNGSLSAKNRIEAYETEAAVQAAEQQDGQLAAAQKAAEMAAKYPAYVTNMGARELTAQLALGALTKGSSLAVTGSGMEMGALLGEWANQVEQMPQAELEKLKPYQRRIQEGMTPAEARADLANTNFFEDDGLKPYLIAAGALGSLDRYLSIGKGVSPLVKQSAGKTLIKSILSDMTREALQEGAAQINQNLAISEINPLQKLLQGVGSATFYGGALGAMSGTVGGTVQAAQHHQAAKQQKAVDDLIGATETEEAKTEEAKNAQTKPYQEEALKAELAKIEDEEQRKAFEDAFMGDVDLGLLEERKQEKTAYGDFVRNVLAAEQAQQTEQTQPTTAEESETQPQTSSHLTEEQLPRFQQYVQRVNQAYQTNNNAALEQALSEFSPEEQALFAQEVARIFIEGRPDVAAAIKQGKSLQEINDMIANPQQAVENAQDVANQPTAAELQQTANVAPTQPRNVVTGTQDTVDIGENNYQPFQYEVMEAEDLAPTQDKADNQLRDRNRTASQAQVNKIARNLDPRKLVDSPTMDMGAPLLAQDGQTVIAGNGRSMALRQAYQEGNADAYKQYLQTNAGKFGLDANQIAGMKNPVLVRRLNTAVDIKQTAINSNEQGGMRMSNLEQAKVDAGRLPNMASFELGENGEINTTANQGFISQFIQNQPETLRNELLDGKGNLSQTGVQRLRNAMLYTAYGDTDTLARAVESTDQGARNIINALTRIAPKVAQVKQDIANGILSDVDISADIVAAVEKYNQLRSQNKDVGEYLQQQDFVSELTPEAKNVLRIFNENNRSAKRISDILTNYYNSAETQGNTAQSSMFGDVDFDKAGTLEQAKNADDIRHSQSLKSKEENIARGSQAMEQAIQYHQDVPNAMFRDGVGWIDFIWGTEGVVKESGKTKGAKGVSHIIEARMRKDNLSYAEAVAFLTQQVPDIIANGRIERDYEISGTRAIAIIRTDGSEVHLIKKGSDNAWLLTGFEPKENQQMNQSRGATTSDLRSNSPIRSRTDEGAVGTDNVQQSNSQSNPQIAQDQQTLSRILGEETARHIRIIDSNTTIPTGENIEKLKANRVEGWYNKNTQEIYIISDSITANRVMGRDERLVWVAWHELAHFGVNVRFGDRLNMFLTEARRHSAVKGLALRIQAADKEMDIDRATEEAIVELHAAQKTGNWAEIESRYGVIPESLKGSSLQQHLAKLARWLRQLLRFVTRKDPNPESDDALFEMLKTVDNSVKSAVKNPQNQTASDGYRYSFAGEKAQTANHSLLEQAKNAVAQGQDPETVRQETGWFTGADGKWRFEIDDDIGNIIASDLYAYQADPDTQTLSVTLGDVLYNEPLFEAYPQLRDYSVVVKPLGNDIDGFYDGKNKSIVLNSNLSGLDMDNTIVHEVQHAIQDIEGFAQGGSTNSQLTNSIKQSTLNAGGIGLSLGGRLKYQFKRIFQNKAQRNANEDLAKYHQNSSAYDIYNSLSGEVEARNVSSRLNLTPEQRRAISPEATEDIPRTQQINIRYQSENFSLSEDPNSEFAKAVEAIANGERSATSEISLGTTPDVLKMLGIDDANVVIHAKTLQKDMIGKHSVSAEAMKQLPKQLNDPIAVVQSRPDSTNPKAYLMLTELKEIENGKELPVIAALNFVQHDNGDLELVEVSSAYGRKNVKVAKDLLYKPYYWNKTKGNQFLKDFALSAENNELLSTLRSSFSSDDYLSVNNVKSEDDLRQYQSENSDDIRFSRSANYRFKKSDLEFNQDRLIGKSMFSIYKNDTLANLFNHSPLFEHFPELANTKVVEDPSLYERTVRYDEQNDSLLVGNFTHPSTFKSAVENLAKEKIKSVPKVKADKQPSAVDDEYMALAKRYENGDLSVEPRLRELVDNQAKANGFDADISFRMNHTAPNAHDGYSVTGDNLAEMVGDDIYSSEAEMYFGTGDERADRESINQIRRMKNRPNAEVTIYRAIPKSFKGTAIGDGDWVSLSRTYTEQHGENTLDGDYKIAMKKVKANELYWNGDSINEFGYDSGNNNYRSSEVNRNKSSELITRTDSGRIIPLSKRFNPEKTDIRYSRRERHSLEDDVKNGQVNPTKENGWSFKGFQSKLIETFIDDTQPVKDYIDQLPLPKQWQKTIKNALDLTPTKRRALTDEYEQRYIKPLLKNIAQMANKHGKDILTTKRFVEYWASLNWSIQRNPELLAKDEQDLQKAEKDLQAAIAQGDQDAIDKAQFAYNAAERQYKYRKADVETTQWRTHTPKVGTAGGWSIPQAEFIKGEIEKIFPEDEIRAALKPLYEMLQHKLDVDLAAGRISQQEYQDYKSKPDYVPLTGNPNEDPEMDFIASSSDKTINTSTDKRMKGRKTSISEGAIDATWREIAKSSTIAAFADFKQELFMVYDALVQEQINQGKSQKEAEKFVAEEYKLSRKRKEGSTRPSDNVLIHKHQGQYYEIGISEEAINALKHKWLEDVNGLLEWIRTPTSWAARGYTQYRVDFALKNMVRDVGERGIFITSREMYKPNGQKVGVMERHIIGAKILSNAFNPAVWTASARYAAKGIQGLRDNVPVEAHFKSLIQEGGVSTIGTYLARSEKDLIKQIEAENAPLAKNLSLAGKAIEGWNKIFDMISSISTAHVLRNHGLDAKMTAATTLNLSNFTHTGKRMRLIKALYAFSQPTAMGGRNLLSHLSTKTGAIQFAALTAAGMVLYSFLRAMDDEDERGNKMDVAGDISREILVPTGNGKYIKIPVPFGMSQMAWNVATNTVRAMERAIKPEDAVVNITSQFFKSNIAFISPSEIPASRDPWAKAITTIMPTFFKPLAEIGQNRSAFGSLIYQENRGNKLDIETAKPTTNQIWRDFAEAVYDLTGIDWAPEVYQYTANSYLRMLGTMGEVAVNAIENPNRELLGRPTVTPVVNGFYGPKGENAIQSMYSEYIAEAEKVHLEYEYLKANGKLKPEWRTEERRNLLYLYNMNKARMKYLDKEYKEILAYRKKPRFSDEMYKRRLATYYRKAEAVQKEIVHRYRKNNGLHTVRP